jgi:hypothetical protein
LHSVENWLWERLWAGRKVQQNERMKSNMANNVAVVLLIKGDRSQSWKIPTENLIKRLTPRRKLFFIS